MTSAGLSLQIEVQAGIVVLQVIGDLDFATGSDLRQAVAGILAAFPGPSVVMDMESLAFCDSSGLGALLGCAREIRATDGRIVWCCVHGRLSRLLSITGLRRAFDIYPTPSEAVAALS